VTKWIFKIVKTLRQLLMKLQILE